MSLAPEPSLSDMLASIQTLKDTASLSVNINFLRNFTVEGIEPYIGYHGLQAGIRPHVTFGEYDSVQQEILNQDSHLYRTAPELIVLALHLETYLQDGWSNPWLADEVMTELAALYGSVAENTSALILVNTFVPSSQSDFGISAARGLFSHHDQVLRLNQLIRDFVTTKPARFLLSDWERYLRVIGAAEALDQRFWYILKAPFKKAFLDLYAQDIIKIAKALKGRAKKCLVLDCDNTLWGGVVGEDGVGGIKLDRHNYPGNVFYDFQKSILNLHKRGVLICLSSKNNEQDVWDVLDKHPDCLVKREHLSAWRVNWDDKATSLSGLAADLNIGIDSFVFVDDNPMECELIRHAHPSVTVLQVPEKIYLLPQLLRTNSLFDTLAISNEDLQRSQMYRDEASRKQGRAKFENMAQYLASLAISISVHRATPAEVPRIAQLTQKTNQFNLTTRRYSESQIEAMCSSSEFAVLSLLVRDRFGESGLTGVLIARKDGAIGVVDSLMLSCRILGRHIEQAFVARALDLLTPALQVSSWRAEYIATQKNTQVADFWPALGFRVKEESQAPWVQYELATLPLALEPVSYIEVTE